jgi:transcriptional regulator with XRE-family HTH domain
MNTVDFPERLATLRHAQGLTQQTLGQQVGIHVSQIRRYEQGTAQPTLDVIRRLTLALNTNADQLIFDPDEQHAILTVIDGILIRHQARKLAS